MNTFIEDVYRNEFSKDHPLVGWERCFTLRHLMGVMIH